MRALLLLLPVILSFLLLVAHFLRAQGYVMVALCLLIPLLLVLRRRWVVWVVQVALLLGAVEWLFTMVRLIEIREQTGEPWTRMAIILGAVMLFTAASGLVFVLPRLRKRYQAPSP